MAFGSKEFKAGTSKQGITKPSLIPGVNRSYTLAFTMRSGSNAICDLLTRNGIGRPTEYFQDPLVPTRGESHLDAFLRFVKEYQRNETFGSKLANYHRARLDEVLRGALPAYQTLDDILPAHQWLRLVRRDKLMQAISLYRAECSGIWEVTEASSNHAVLVEYDFYQILSRIVTIDGCEFAWDLYFQQHDIKPYVIVYEDFFADLHNQLRSLVAFLGGALAALESLEIDTSFKIQRDEVNYGLRQRFMADITRTSNLGVDELRSVTLLNRLESALSQKLV